MLMMRMTTIELRSKRSFFDRKVTFQLAQVLPVDENFLLLFQLENRLTSSVEFMKLWHVYDADHNGFIEGAELEVMLQIT